MGLPVNHINFVTAFFNCTINRYNIFIVQPLAYEVKINLTCKLLKALYGQKQSPQIWYPDLCDFLYMQKFV